MFRNISASAICVAAAVTLGAGSAQAVSLSDLVSGSTMTQGDVTFSGFSYEDVGGPFGLVAVSASDIDVTTFAAGTKTGLTFSTSIGLSADQELEFRGSFLASVSAGSSRKLTDTTFGLDDATAVGSLAFVAFGSNTFGHTATVEDGVPAPQSFSSPLADVTSQAVEWDVQAGAEEDNGPGPDSASITSFSITFDLSGQGVEPPMPPSADVPLPASLPLLFAALGGLGYMRRRR